MGVGIALAAVPPRGGARVCAYSRVLRITVGSVTSARKQQSGAAIGAGGDVDSEDTAVLAVARLSAQVMGAMVRQSISRWVVRRRTATGYRTQVLMSAVPDGRMRANVNYQQAVIRAMNIRTSDPQPKLAHCSFCSEPQNVVKLLIAGPNALVCNDCVRLRSDIAGNHDRSAAGSQPHA